MPIRLSDAVARLKNRRKRQKHETVEQATAAPGEIRDVHITITTTGTDPEEIAAAVRRKIRRQ